MRYVMRQHWLSFGDMFTIRDENDRDAVHVRGKVFSFGDKLTLSDAAGGGEVARIEQRLLNWGPTYEIHRDGQLAAVVKKHLFTLFKTRFTVDVPGPDDLEAAGNFLQHEYAFTRGGREVAAVSKRWFSWTDTYGIDVSPGEDDVLILAATVVIDLVSHDDNRGGD